MKKKIIIAISLFLIGCGDKKESVNDPFVNLSNSKKENIELKIEENYEKESVEVDKKDEVNNHEYEKERVVLDKKDEVSNHEYEKERIVLDKKDEVSNQEYEKERVVLDKKDEINYNYETNLLDNDFLKTPIISLKNEKDLSSYYREDIIESAMSKEDKEYNNILKKIHSDYLDMLNNISSQFNIHRETTFKEFKNYEKDILDYYAEMSSNKKLNCVEEKIKDNEHLCMNYEKQIMNIKEQYENLKTTLKEYIDKLNNDEIINFEKYKIQYEKNINNLKQQYETNKNKEKEKTS